MRFIPTYIVSQQAEARKAHRPREGRHKRPAPENPRQYKYVKILRVILHTIGGWPGEALGEHVPFIIKFIRKYCCAQAVALFVGQMYYLYEKNEVLDFLTKGHCYITCALCVTTIIRTSILSFKKYGEIVKTFIMTFNLGHHQHKGEYYKQMHMTIYKISHYFTLYSVIMMLFGMWLFNLTSVYENIRNGAFSRNRGPDTKLELTIYFSYPGFDPLARFNFVTILNLYLAYNCGIAICVLDLFLSLMAFQIIGHILILRNNFKILPKPAQIMFDAEENENVHKKIVECVQYHREIVSFAEELSSFFGPVLGFNYAFQLVSLCLLLLESSHGHQALVRFGPMTFIIFGQLITLSVTFEVIGTVSEKLKDSVYDIEWECMDTRNRRIVCILLHRVQTPLHVTAMGLTPVGVTTMAAILRTTFSYFAFLRSMSE
ncbi:uncharacterized protein LOC126367645 [Pectinophora gossypiella]|uniref:uncharacterized protein LOC126367645 n=1 Tax=Pectinophora gossypiella TaxID=13191 RepID=UPI00214F5D83|nr:uncharacterized protein LOC126367645 [Pectinophora gossypiella]